MDTAVQALLWCCVLWAAAAGTTLHTTGTFTHGKTASRKHGIPEENMLELDLSQNLLKSGVYKCEELLQSRSSWCPSQQRNQTLLIPEWCQCREWP